VDTQGNFAVFFFLFIPKTDLDNEFSVHHSTLISQRHVTIYRYHVHIL